MTSFERLRKIFDFDMCVDSLPVMEYAPYWDKTLDAWRKSGLALENWEDTAIHRHFGLESHKWLQVSPCNADCPAPASQGAPLVLSEQDYDVFKKRYLYPEDPVWAVRDYLEAMKPHSDRGEIVYSVNVEGAFWGPRHLLGIENHLMDFYDEPDLMHRINRDLFVFNLRAVDEFRKITEPGFVTLSEDMSYNHGPMIGKPLFEEFLRPYYLDFVREMHGRGLLVIYDSDGMIEEVVPWLIECGIDGILPLERQAGVDVNRIRRDFPQFRMFGGFDKTVMKDGEAAMRKEFERIFPTMRSGGYVPTVDHQTPPDVTPETYALYVALLKEYCQKAAQS